MRSELIIIDSSGGIYQISPINWAIRLARLEAQERRERKKQNLLEERRERIKKRMEQLRAL